MVGRIAVSPPKISDIGGRMWPTTSLLSPSGPPGFSDRRRQNAHSDVPRRNNSRSSNGTTRTRISCNRWRRPARPSSIGPSAFLKQYHETIADAEELAFQVEDARVKSWAALHNKLDNLYKFDNHELPTLQPWLNASSGKKIRHNFVRNPYYHRIDSNGCATALYRRGRDGDRCPRSGCGQNQRRGKRSAGRGLAFPRCVDPEKR